MSFIQLYKCDSCQTTAEGRTPVGRGSPFNKIPDGWLIVNTNSQKHLCSIYTKEIFKA